ncbi:MAG: hypothetical protein AABZ16_02565, partial [candidate division NC10 bacterium]
PERYRAARTFRLVRLPGFLFGTRRRFFNATPSARSRRIGTRANDGNCGGRIRALARVSRGG